VRICAQDLKQKYRHTFEVNHIRVWDFKEVNGPIVQLRKKHNQEFKEKLKSLPPSKITEEMKSFAFSYEAPFAIVGRRGAYMWGTCDPELPEHSELPALRDILLKNDIGERQREAGWHYLRERAAEMAICRRVVPTAAAPMPDPPQQLPGWARCFWPSP